MAIIEIILFCCFIRVSCWLFKGMTGYDVIEEHYRYDASEARQQTTNKSNDSFADGIFWSDLGNH
jgi:hypothetical protein